MIDTDPLGEQDVRKRETCCHSLNGTSLRNSRARKLAGRCDGSGERTVATCPPNRNVE
jgi:hypothetical protein